jgi:hypothetical protein
MKKHVAKNVATPKHTQDTQEYLMDNHEKVEHTQTHREHVENLLVRLPPSALLCSPSSLLTSSHYQGVRPKAMVQI